MGTKRCIAMVLAGGRGVRLGALSHFYSKSAVYFGGNHRVIDFTLNNCYNAGIDTIGILSQYFTTDLNTYISTTHGSRHKDSSIYMLPSENRDNFYRSTADAIYKNITFIDRYHPDNVLILSGDHIYNMDYGKMIEFHEESDADVTIASTYVPISETSRFGILNAAKSGRVLGFKEKPIKPKSDLASMGVYIFKWNILKNYLLAVNKRRQSQHDFGMDIIPSMLSSGENVYTYRFHGYWRDVGTVRALWEANMDQIDESAHRLSDIKWKVPHMDESSNIISGNAEVRQSIMSGGCTILGKVEHSVLSDSVTIGKNSEVVNSVIMPNVYIGNNVKIHNAIIGTRAKIMDGTGIGTEYGSNYFVDHQVCSRGISLVAPWLYIAEGMRFQKNSHIYEGQLNQYDYIRGGTDTTMCVM